MKREDLNQGWRRTLFKLSLSLLRRTRKAAEKTKPLSLLLLIVTDTKVLFLECTHDRMSYLVHTWEVRHTRGYERDP